MFGFGFFYYDWTILIVLPAMLFAFWAEHKVKETFKKYSKTRTHSGLTGAQAARRLLDANGLYDVDIMMVERELSDHYNPRDKKLYLSRAVHDSNSASAIGVACHEAGHALQDAHAYAPLKIRMGMVPVCNIGSQLAFPLFFIGLLIGELGWGFMVAGIACFSLATLFQLVTLPVEFNASHRAMTAIRDSGYFSEEEADGSYRVLKAAAMTYVAALAVTLAQILRLLLIVLRVSGRGRD